MRTMDDLAAATYLYQDDLVHLLRTHETATVDQDKKMNAAVLGASLGWVRLYTTDYTAQPANYSYAATAFTVVPTWVADTVTTLNSFVRPTAANGFFYQCVARTGTFKTDAATEPTWSTTLGFDTIDDEITWRCRGLNVIATPTDLSSIFLPGVPLKYVYNSVTYYGMVLYASADYVGLVGAPLSSSYALTALYYAPLRGAVTVELHKVGDYDAGAAAVVTDNEVIWLGQAASLVTFAVKHRTNATGAGTNPYVNPTVGGSVVSTNGDGASADRGIQVSTSWQENSAVAIKTANYHVDRGDAIGVSITVTGSNPDAAGLSVCAILVLE